MSRTIKISLALLSILFLLGIWHAFPLTSVVYDENYFAGGVLRSLQAHSIFPQGIDVPYGTLTFYLSYLTMLPVLLVTLFFTHFSITLLTQYLLFHPWIGYLPVRLISLLAFIALLIITERFWRKYLERESDRLALLILTFTALLPIALVHTGKVWIVSVFLLLTSFMTLIKSGENNDVGKFAFISVFSAVLAFANFPIMGIALINMPILLWQNRSDKNNLKKLVKYICISLGVFILLILTNSSGIHSQVSSIINSYTLSPESRVLNLSFISSLLLNLYKTLRFFPIILLTLISALFSKCKLRDKRLFTLSVIYLCAYIIAISIVARWSTGLHSFVRYLLPVPFLLAHIIASLNLSNFNLKPKLDRIFKGLAFISFVGAIYLTSLAIKPTTYNQAFNYIKNNFSTERTLIINEASPELALPMNRYSYGLIKQEFCGSLCQATLDNKITNNFTPIVITEQSKATDLLMMYSFYYLISKSNQEQKGELIASFETGVQGNQGLILDNVADYFDPNFWHIKRFGANIYIYKIKIAF